MIQVIFPQILHLVSCVKLRLLRLLRLLRQRHGTGEMALARRMSPGTSTAQLVI